jgi:hypothetical protein
MDHPSLRIPMCFNKDFLLEFTIKGATFKGGGRIWAGWSMES